jgi:hypothetical protein
MGLEPASHGAAMLTDALSHPLSLLQALLGAELAVDTIDRRAEAASATTEPDAYDVSFRAAGARGTCEARVVLRHAARQPRRAWLALDGHHAERTVRLDDYTMQLTEGQAAPTRPAGGARSVPLPDPLEAHLAAFLDALARAPSERPRGQTRMTRGQREWLALRCRTLSFPSPRQLAGAHGARHVLPLSTTMPTRADFRIAMERLTTHELLARLGVIGSRTYTDDALAVIRELLAERGVDPEAARAPECPACGRVLELDQGDLESRTGCLPSLLVGVGYQPAWFTSRESGHREVVLRPRTPRAAARCKHCGLVMFGSRV